MTLFSWMFEASRRLPCDPAKRTSTALLGGEVIRDLGPAQDFDFMRGFVREIRTDIWRPC